MDRLGGIAMELSFSNDDFKDYAAIEALEIVAIR